MYHSDHKPADVEQYLGLAREFELGITGGSDFHGDVKPGVRLGSGAGRESQHPAVGAGAASRDPATGAVTALAPPALSSVPGARHIGRRT